MFPSMRRRLQQLDEVRAYEILAQASHAVLSVTDSVTSYAYSVPISYTVNGNHLYIHSAPVGHKIAALKANPKVSVCVVEQDEIHPERLTSYFRSVIAFGTASFVTDPEQKRKALKRLVDKYAPGFEALGKEEAEQKLNYIAIIDITIEHITGKESIELVKKNRNIQKYSL